MSNTPGTPDRIPDRQGPRSRPLVKGYDIDCQLAYTLPGATDFVFQVHALHGLDQAVVSESLRLTPRTTAHHVYADPLIGQRFLRVHTGAGRFGLRYRARVEVRRPRPDKSAQEWPVAALPDEVLHYLMPTRHCESDLLAGATLKLFGTVPPGYARVQAICDWITRHVEYRLGSSSAATCATDTFLQRAGVCRDFAHLGVTFCRALNIPARLAVGYAIYDEPPPDFHAVFEAFVGGRWELFDATHLSAPRELVRITVGRDAKDVAFATIFGAAQTRAIRPLVTRV